MEPKAQRAMALTSPAWQQRATEPLLPQSCAVVIAQHAVAVVAESQEVAAVLVEWPAARYLMYLEPTLLDQLLDQCCAAMPPSPDSSR